MPLFFQWLPSLSIISGTILVSCLSFFQFSYVADVSLHFTYSLYILENEKKAIKILVNCPSTILVYAYEKNNQGTRIIRGKNKLAHVKD